jgi:membrane protein DedA with SNARE-associated domain
MILAGSITSFIDSHGDWALPTIFVLLTLESFGLPVPGETALIAGAVLASHGSFPLAVVIVVGIAAAVIGDNLGYWTARRGGRKLLYRFRLTHRYAEHYLPRGERFFAKHGGKAVFFGRFVAVLRVTAAWTAGLVHMDWWRFLAFNAAGAIIWATLVAVVSYLLGSAAADAIGRYGLLAAGGVVAITALGFLVARRIEQRVVEEEPD